MASSSDSKKFCCVCQIPFNSDAELAIHEFSKKHCDNLLRLSKNKPIKTKTVKPAAAKNEPQKQAVEVMTQPINVSLYGYFSSSDQLAVQPKEFNTKYDPYLQKLADNPHKIHVEKEEPAFNTTNVTSFSKSKKKKKKSCQICNVSMMNIPEFEAHMKSPQHIWKLKVSGMGVSAHFVKASTDLHTADKNVEDKALTATDQKSIAQPVPISPAELFCDICGLLLNSKQQYEAHLIGKSHTDNVQRKTNVQAPNPNQLYCYSCKLSLNNVFQFNEHKSGKKHKMKCRTLMREGYTIPPEERPPDMAWNLVVCSPVRYPEGYQQNVVNKQVNNEVVPVSKAVETVKAGPSEKLTTNKTAIIFYDEKNVAETVKANSIFEKAKEVIVETEGSKAARKVTMTATEGPKDFQCTICEERFPNQPPFELHLNSESHALKLVSLKKSGIAISVILTKLMEDRKFVQPDRYQRHCCGFCAIVSQNSEEFKRHLTSLLHKYVVADYSKKRRSEILQAIEANEENLYFCKLCDESWHKLTEYYTHLHSQKHKSVLWKENQIKLKTYRWPHLKIKRFGSWRNKIEERNPGVRTKVGGIAKDLSSGVAELVPNLEVIEAKIDNSKNVSLGLLSSSNAIKKRKMLPARRRPGMINFKLPPPRPHQLAPLPYLMNLPNSPQRPPRPLSNTSLPPPRVQRYLPYSRPNPVYQFPQRPYYRPAPPFQYSNWRPNYPYF